jgi:hypothetical protein
MGSKFNQGFYQPKFPEKFIGNTLPTYRSGWENTVMQFFDNHPNVKFWSSESVSIPYHDPVTGKNRKYIPDFLVVYETIDKKRIVEMVEVKPSKETGMKKVKGAKAQSVIATNQAKWASAIKYCEQNGIKFRVITELEIFGHKGKK